MKKKPTLARNQSTRGGAVTLTGTIAKQLPEHRPIAKNQGALKPMSHKGGALKAGKGGRSRPHR
jgi:hypothetical protein